MFPDLDQLRRTAVEVALQAGREVMRVYRSRALELETKGDGSPLTLADRAADAAIHRALAPGGVPILSEETHDEDDAAWRAWPRYWCVDPLDGTRDFVARTGDFTVNIALFEGDRPVIGVIAAPGLGLVWSARTGGGVWRRAGASAEVRVPRHARSGERVGLMSRFHAGREKEVLHQLGVTRALAAGSAVKLARMAEGSADIYPRFGRTMRWDVAAGDCLVREAGCTLVEATTGAPFGYGDSLANPGFVVLSDRMVQAFETWRQSDGPVA